MHASTRVRTGSGAVMETAAAPSARPLTRRELAARERLRARRSLTAAGVFLGVGLGGFVDGIVLHQILQWHHLLTDLSEHESFPQATVQSLEENTLWDGLFHAATWIFVAVGLSLLWRALSAGARTTSLRF